MQFCVAVLNAIAVELHEPTPSCEGSVALVLVCVGWNEEPVVTWKPTCSLFLVWSNYFCFLFIQSMLQLWYILCHFQDYIFFRNSVCIRIMMLNYDLFRRIINLMNKIKTYEIETFIYEYNTTMQLIIEGIFSFRII